MAICILFPPILPAVPVNRVTIAAIKTQGADRRGRLTVVVCNRIYNDIDRMFSSIPPQLNVLVFGHWQCS